MRLIMNLIHPVLHAPAHRGHAASLRDTLAWYLSEAWRTLEGVGQRRAAPELRRLAHRLAREGDPAAADLLQTSQAWMRR